MGHRSVLSALCLLAFAVLPRVALAQPISPQAQERWYQGFRVWVDCERRGPVLFNYTAHRDSGSLGREGGYRLDPDFDPECQSKSNRPFGTSRGVPYDVGHQVPVNHMDGSARAVVQVNYWTNLLPQTSSMNRGAWRQTEDIIECVRDQTPLELWGGAIWTNAKSNFVRSHGMQTPSAYWKVAIRTDNRDAMAWIIPNGKAPRGALNRYIKTVAEVEALTGQHFMVADRNSRPAASWQIPRGCSLR